MTSAFISTLTRMTGYGGTAVITCIVFMTLTLACPRKYCAWYNCMCRSQGEPLRGTASFITPPHRHQAGLANMDGNRRQRPHLITGLELSLTVAAVLSLTSGVATAEAAIYDSRNCTFPTRGTLRPLPAASVSAATLDDARAVAWEFAPILYLHQLEKYTFQARSRHT